MPIIDPGMTVVDDFGRPLLSQTAIHLPKPNNIPAAPVNTQEIPSAIQGPAQIAPTPEAQGQTNLPRYSIPSDRYAEVERAMPQRDDPSFQHHGLRKLGDILSSIQGGLLTAPARYDQIKQAPFNRAMSDWNDKLAAIKPEVQYEEYQGRERGEEKRSEATLAASEKQREATQAHQRATEGLTEQEREIQQQRETEQERRNQETEKAERRRESLRQAFENDKIKHQNEVDANLKNYRDQELKIQRDREAREKNQAKKGHWVTVEGEDGKPIVYDPDTGEIKAVPGNVQRPGTFAKQEAKLKPLRDANSFAEEYIKTGKFDGPHDEALLEKYFEAAKTSTGFRMTQPQMDMLLKARGVIEGMQARGQHLADGSYFDAKQRQQIVKTMKDLALAAGAVKKEESAPNSDIKIHWPGEK